MNSLTSYKHSMKCKFQPAFCPSRCHFQHFPFVQTNISFGTQPVPNQIPIIGAECSIFQPRALQYGVNSLQEFKLRPCLLEVTVTHCRVKPRAKQHSMHPEHFIHNHEICLVKCLADMWIDSDRSDPLWTLKVKQNSWHPHLLEHFKLLQRRMIFIKL